MHRRIIWKFKVEVAESFTVDMPRGALFLACQVQNGEPQMWMLVDEREPLEPYLFHVSGTGHEIPEGMPERKHLATFQTNGGAFVWHLFEEALQHAVREVMP